MSPTRVLHNRSRVREADALCRCDGTHDALVAANKTYAHLYLMQAAGYA